MKMRYRIFLGRRMGPRKPDGLDRGSPEKPVMELEGVWRGAGRPWRGGELRGEILEPLRPLFGMEYRELGMLALRSWLAMGA